MSNFVLPLVMASAIASTTLTNSQVGIIYQKSDNIGPFYSYKKNDSVPKGYVKGSYKFLKFDYENQNANDLVAIAFNVSFVPGIAAPQGSPCEKSWLLYKAEFQIIVEDNGGDPVFLYAAPVFTGVNEYTITTSTGYTFGTINKTTGSLSLTDGFKYGNSTEIITSVSFGKSETHIEKEPVCVSGHIDVPSPAYYWNYKYDWGKNECRKTLNQVFLLVVETRNQFAGEKCGLRIKANAYLDCNKDWFSGNSLLNEQIVDIYL